MNNINTPEDSIDLKFYFGIFIKNKKTIGVIAFFASLLSAFYSLLLPRIWQGDFEMVIKNSSSDIGNLSLSELTGFDLPNLPFGGASSENSLETEIEILKSEFILKPIFDEIKKDKENSGKKVDDYKFENWVDKNFEIENIRNTTVIQVDLRNNNKDLIVPLLKKITKIYQNYAEEKEFKDINREKEYLGKVIPKYRRISAESNRKLVDFALKNDLSQDLDLNKIELTNQIYNIQNILKNSDNLSDEDVIILAETYLAEIGTFENLLLSLYELNSEIVSMSNFYTDQSYKLKRTLRARNRLISKLRPQILQALKSQKVLFQVQKEASQRPDDIMIKFNQLTIQAERDNIALVALENLYNTLNIKSAKGAESWQIIKPPNLSKIPYSPHRKRIVFIGFLLGILIGLTISIYKFYREDESNKKLVS